MASETMEILVNNGIEIGALIITTVVSYILLWLRNRNIIEKDLQLDILAAVDVTYTGFVRPLKREGGGLTEEQKVEARNRAINTLIELGETRGMDYVKKYGLKALGALVESCVRRIKK